jgi:hypothetical protein
MLQDDRPAPWRATTDSRGNHPIAASPERGTRPNPVQIIGQQRVGSQQFATEIQARRQPDCRRYCRFRLDVCFSRDFVITWGSTRIDAETAKAATVWQSMSGGMLPASCDSQRAATQRSEGPRADYRPQPDPCDRLVRRAIPECSRKETGSCRCAVSTGPPANRSMNIFFVVS